MELKITKISIFTILILLLLTLSACTPSSTTPTITQTIKITLAPTLTPTRTPYPTKTPKPTLTPTQTPVPVSSVRIEDAEILKSSIMTFSLDGNIWVVDHGEKRQLTFSSKDSSPKLLPSGNQIIFIRSTWEDHEWSEESCRSITFSNLMMIDIDGSDETVIVPADQILPIYTEKPVMYDDEHELAWCGIGIYEFSVQPIDNPQILLFSTSTESRYGRMDDLFSYNLSSKEITQLVLPMQGGVYEISPDGKWVALANELKLDLISLTSFQTEARILQFQPTHEGPPYIYFPRLKWNSDSDSIFVVTEAGEPFNALDFQNAVWEIDLKSLNPRKVVQFEASSFNTNPMTGVISPDSNKIAFPCRDDYLEVFRICLSSLDGTLLKSVVLDLGEYGKMDYLAWTPNSDALIVNSNIGISIDRNGHFVFDLEVDFQAYGDEIFWLTDTLFLISDPDHYSQSNAFLVNLETREAFLVEDVYSLSDILLLEIEE